MKYPENIKEISTLNPDYLGFIFWEKSSRYMDLESIPEIPKLKKLSANNNYYRLRIGDFRIGMSIINKEIYLIRFLHRKDIYKYFP